MTDLVHRGGCLCRSVRYKITGPLRDVMYCHCEQCRRTSGHFVAASACARNDLAFNNDEGLRWYPSSKDAERGFCAQCGSSLFWRIEGREAVSVMAGSLDTPTSLRATSHIFVADASDYYTLSDGLPQSTGYPDESASDTESDAP